MLRSGGVHLSLELAHCVRVDGKASHKRGRRTGRSVRTCICEHAEADVALLQAIMAGRAGPGHANERMFPHKRGGERGGRMRGARRRNCRNYEIRQGNVARDAAGGYERQMIGAPRGRSVMGTMQTFGIRTISKARSNQVCRWCAAAVEGRPGRLRAFTWRHFRATGVKFRRHCACAAKARTIKERRRRICRGAVGRLCVQGSCGRHGHNRSVAVRSASTKQSWPVGTSVPRICRSACV